MNQQQITFTNEMGEALAPFLKFVRATGFFEAPVFMSTMTLLALVIFFLLIRKMKTNGTFNTPIRLQMKSIILFLYFSTCFLATNSLAVAFKTLIVEELDYGTSVWFMHLLAPLHFYITAVALAYIWLIWRNKQQVLDKLLCVFIQIGLLGGYYTGIHRLQNEPFELTDVTTGMSGIFFLLWFGILNADIFSRFFSKNEFLMLKT